MSVERLRKETIEHVLEKRLDITKGLRDHPDYCLNNDKFLELQDLRVLRSPVGFKITLDFEVVRGC